MFSHARISINSMAVTSKWKLLLSGLISHLIGHQIKAENENHANVKRIKARKSDESVFRGKTRLVGWGQHHRNAYVCGFRPL
jgi:hypothetical protein